MKYEGRLKMNWKKCFLIAALAVAGWLVLGFAVFGGLQIAIKIFGQGI